MIIECCSGVVTVEKSRPILIWETSVGISIELYNSEGFPFPFSMSESKMTFLFIISPPVVESATYRNAVLG